MKKKNPILDTIQAILMAFLAAYCGIVTTQPTLTLISFALGGIIALNALLHIGMYWLPSTKEKLAGIRDAVERHDKQYNLFVNIDLYSIVLAFCVYTVTQLHFLVDVLKYYFILILIVNILNIWRWTRERRQRRLGRLMTLIGIIALPVLNSCQSCSPSGIRQQQFEREARQKAMEKADERVFFTVTDFLWGFPLNLPTKQKTITIEAQTYEPFGENATEKETRFDLVVIAGKRSLKDLETDLLQGPKAIFYLDRKDIKKSVRMQYPERDCSVMLADDIHRLAVSKDTILIPTLISR